MKLTDFARRLPEEVWAVFEPILPPVALPDDGRKPIGNRECLHALFYVLVSGIAWGSLWAFPPTKPSSDA